MYSTLLTVYPFFFSSNNKCLKDCPFLLISLRHCLPTSQPGNLASVSITYPSQNPKSSQHLCFYISGRLLISSTYSSNSSPSFNTFDFILALYKIIEYLPCASHYASAEDTVTVPVLICALEPSGKDRF